MKSQMEGMKNRATALPQKPLVAQLRQGHSTPSFMTTAFVKILADPSVFCSRALACLSTL